MPKEGIDHGGSLILMRWDLTREVADNRFADGGVILEAGTPEQIFDYPKEDRTKEFLSKVL